MLDQEDKRCIRAVVRKIHPDKFMQYPKEQAVNSESLKTLNSFLEGYVEGQVVRSSSLQFWTMAQADELVKVEVGLSGRQSLFDLFEAFDVEHAHKDDARRRRDTESDLDFLKYMQSKISEALTISERFRSLSNTATELKSEISERYCFEDLRFQDVVRTSCSNAVWQVSALQMLSKALESLDGESQLTFANQRIVLHRERKRTFSAVQGREIHLVANRTLKSQLRKIDTQLLSTLSKLNSYWKTRISKLIPAVQSVLRVKAVLGDFVYSGDGYNTSSAEDAVIWAGKILRAKEAFEEAFGDEEPFHFSVLVHSDESTPYIDMNEASTMIQVRADCPPSALIAFMCSKEARGLNEKVQFIENHRTIEADHLASVKKALKARQVIRVCSVADTEPFYDACERLVENADYILQHVELKGIFLAIDDCYELWESGFISIPYNFEIETLCEKLKEALPPQKKAPNLLLGDMDMSVGGTTTALKEDTQDYSSVSRNSSRQVSSNCICPQRHFVSTFRMIPSPVARHRRTHFAGRHRTLNWQHAGCQWRRSTKRASTTLRSL